MQSHGSTKAVARSSQASEPSKALSAADYFAIADRDFPGGGLGGYALPEAVRFLPARARGSRIEDIEGRSYIDFVGGAGAMILGHAHPAVTAAITEQAALGTHFFGTLNQPALHLAELMRSALPYAEKIAFTTSGSEATFYALRMCRAFTGRDKILKFDGAYHGNHDYSVVSFASKSIANYPVGRADTGGVPSVLPPRSWWRPTTISLPSSALSRSIVMTSLRSLSSPFSESFRLCRTFSRVCGKSPTSLMSLSFSMRW